MKGKDLLEKMNLVDSKYVEEADKAKKKPVPWKKWTACAACVTAAAVVGVLALRLPDIPDPIPPVIEGDRVPETGETEPLPETTPATEVPETTPGTETTATHPEAETGNTNIGGIVRDYNELFVLQNTELAIEWTWEYKTDTERYTELTVDGVHYTSGGRYLDASLLDKSVGTYDIVGYDYATDTEHRMAAEVFRIDGVTEKSMLAAELDGKYVIFKERSYNPPATFGELLDDYSLAETLPFHRFTMYEGYTDTGYYSLEDDWEIWQILGGCRDAEYLEVDNWHSIEGEYASFTATSDALGAYKKVFRVTADGYVKTNVFDYGYTYHIGEEAAGKILAYVKSHSTAAAPEPYTNTLAGKLVAIGDGYILADDSFLCTDQTDGMVFRIPTDDLRISRSMKGIEVGDVIVVNFTGEIDVEAGNVVTGAYSLAEGYVADGDVAVIE